MRYDLPEVRGAAELWGKRVFHCPYCHGWEVRDKRVAVYGCSDRAVHQALLLSSVTDDVVLLCDEANALSPDQAVHLESAGIRAEPRRATDLYERDGALQVALKDAPALARDAIFIQPKLSLASDLAASLGAEHNETGTVATDTAGLSTVPNLYVAGDAATAVQSVAVAAGSGARAAYAMNAELAIHRPHVAT
jgi:thioredoxin reductase